MKKIIKYGVVFCLIAGVAAASYVLYLSGQVDKRFSGRRWQIPSTVYSDTTVLFVGKKIDSDRLHDKLIRTGYTQKEKDHLSKGNFNLDQTDLTIYLKDLNLPWNTRDGYLAEVRIRDNRVYRLHKADSGESVPLIEIGPEKLMQFFGSKRETRDIVRFPDIPETLINAVIAAEDHRFYSHFGVDPKGILRALVTNIRYGKVKQGGSTLTQQLAKNYFLNHERTLSRKLKELFLSLAIEFKYSKQEIMEIYLNEIYFGQKGSVSVNGAGEAARFYFGKKIKALNLSESAVLAGMIKGPNLYSPYSNRERCLQRRNSVLDSMLEMGMITPEEHEYASQPLLETTGYVGYSKKAPYFIDYVTGQLSKLYSPTVLNSMGYSVYTTLDMDVQTAAENALLKGLKALEKKKPQLKREAPEKQLQGAVIVMQPRTGNILAMVGGRDYRVSQFNRVSQAKRQPGSCFKPIVTSVLLDVFKPSDRLSNEKISYIIDGKMWTPDNYSNHLTMETISLRNMLAKSCNRAAVDLVVKGGVESVAKQTQRFCFSDAVKPLPSIALGAFEVRPIELARAYCAFAADGTEPYPLSVKDVVDENGSVLLRKHVDMEQVLSASESFLMTSMLQSVVTDGTAISLAGYGFDFDIAGKTGTTNDYRDTWFIGYTPDFLALVWIGFDNGESVYSTGSGAALPVWAELVSEMSGYVTNKSFPVPPGITRIKVCRDSGDLAVVLKCPRPYEEYFLKENTPGIKCRLHAGSSVVNQLLQKFKGLFNATE